MARDRDDDDRGYRDNDRGYRDDDRDDDAPRGDRDGPPPTYLVPAILVTLCCCTIGGVIAIVNAAQVNSKWRSGDRVGARYASDRAKLWCWLSAAIGIVIQPVLLYFRIEAEMNDE